MSDVWYYARGGKSVGPLTLGELKIALSGVSEAKDILVWRDSFSNWLKVEDVPELAPHVIKPPPLPVSPTCLPQKAIAARGKRSPWAVSFYVFYVVGFIALAGLIGRDNRFIGLAFFGRGGPGRWETFGFSGGLQTEAQPRAES
jgi:hypothetical protein